jgi:hypothetical protein
MTGAIGCRKMVLFDSGCNLFLSSRFGCLAEFSSSLSGKTKTFQIVRRTKHCPSLPARSEG